MKCYDFLVQVILCFFIMLEIPIFGKLEEISASVHSRQANNILLSFDGFKSVIITDERYVFSCSSFKNDKVSQFIGQLTIFSFSLSVSDSSFNGFEKTVGWEIWLNVDQNHRGYDWVEHVNSEWIFGGIGVADYFIKKDVLKQMSL